MTGPAGARPAPVSAVVLTYNRKQTLLRLLDRLADPALGLDEVVVVDSGSTDGTAEAVRARPDVVLVEPGSNVAVAGRNLGARAARNELLLMLDDDAYPVPGAVEALCAALAAVPATAVVGGLVLDVEADGQVLKSHEVGTFDWFLRGGRRGEAPVGGWPCFFFPEGASLVRRTPYFEVGGYFEPYFFATSEVDLTTRLVGAGYDVRYEPRAQFHHLKVTEGRTGSSRVLRYRVRNQIWYFWRHFPTALAVRRIVAYAGFDLIEALAVGAVRDYAGGLVDSWRQRDAVRGTRSPLPRAVLRRAELNRGRIHLRLLAEQLTRKTLRRVGGRPAPQPEGVVNPPADAA
ncbi:MAG: hypothetical protein QOJ79_2949 [Actinomycetota bacterium]|nr:hypothetical protein [Actinomycetota bacterium]